MVSDRAYLKGARLGDGLARVETTVTAILEALSDKDALRVEPSVLQPADVLLDLYGEDIRSRAFVTQDDGAEMMLRPDFTLPIARMHMASAAPEAAARYVYSGPVWRRQEFGSDRPREYLQTGLEIFGDVPQADADAEVLTSILAAFAGDAISVLTGDMGLLFAAIAELDTTQKRRAALLRHVWRPARLRDLLRRYGADHAQVSAARKTLLKAARSGALEAKMHEAGAFVGLRSAQDVADRVAWLVDEAASPALAPDDVDFLDRLMQIKCNSADALAQLRAVSAGRQGFSSAVDRFAARLDAFAERGLLPERLEFSTSARGLAPEYYDGFVFVIEADAMDNLPPLASGGRYDALTEALGQGERIPAVGGMIRPEALIAARQETK